MEGIEKIGNLSDVKNRKYIGYIWKSNVDKPQILKTPTAFDFTHIETNPFVQEALLYCPDEDISLTVRHTGTYQITEFDLNKIPKEALEFESYYAHRIDGVKKINFKQLWLPKPDENCEDMEVLTLKAHIFTGFSN